MSSESRRSGVLLYAGLAATSPAFVASSKSRGAAPATGRRFWRGTPNWGRPAPGGRTPLVVYLKRHHELPFWRGLLATIWPGGNWSPAMMEFEHLEWARKQGVPVPATVAAGELLGGWGKLQ